MRQLVLYDLGRFDLAIRTGFLKQLRTHGWGLVVAGGSVRYRKRVHLFDKVTMKTQMLGFDERWIYMSQSMWVKGEACSAILLRTGVTRQGRTVPTQDLLTALGYPADDPNLPGPLPAWAKAWIEADDQRPWPP